MTSSPLRSLSTRISPSPSSPRPRPAAHLIKKELNLKSGSAKPQADKVGQLSQEQLTKIAEIKMPDLNANDIDAAKKIIAGTARSMGVTIAE